MYYVLEVKNKSLVDTKPDWLVDVVVPNKAGMQDDSISVVVLRTVCIILTRPLPPFPGYFHPPVPPCTSTTPPGGQPI
jgi:hypothetical protein